jgi:hypothetical protein
MRKLLSFLPFYLILVFNLNAQEFGIPRGIVPTQLGTIPMQMQQDTIQRVLQFLHQILLLQLLIVLQIILRI